MGGEATPARGTLMGEDIKTDAKRIHCAHKTTKGGVLNEIKLGIKFNVDYFT